MLCLDKIFANLHKEPELWRDCPIIPGQTQHVIQRVNNRNLIFVAEQDYQYYLQKLGDACKKYDCELHAYVLMTNQVHLS